MEVEENSAAWLGHRAWVWGESGEIPSWKDQWGPYLADTESLIRQGARGEPLKKRDMICASERTPWLFGENGLVRMEAGRPIKRLL